jgi:hypothetical protein
MSAAAARMSAVTLMAAATLMALESVMACAAITVVAALVAVAVAAISIVALIVPEADPHRYRSRSIIGALGIGSGCISGASAQSRYQ